MPTLTTTPLLVGGTGQTVSGRVAIAPTATYEFGGEVVTTTPKAGVVKDGQFFAADGYSPLLLLPTPEGIGMRIVLHLEAQTGAGTAAREHVISRTVAVPDATSVAWDDLVDIVPVIEGGDYIVPPWAATVLEARDEAVGIADTMIVDGDVVGDSLILTRQGGGTINAGVVKGDKGDKGDPASFEPVELGVEDLDTITSPGYYYQTQTTEATPERNYPVSQACAVRVTANAARTQVQQEVKTFPTSKPEMFWRNFYNGTWSAWRQLIDDSDARLSDARTPTAHGHAIGDVTGLQPALDAKVATSDARLSDARTPLAHTHDTSQVSGLDALLAGKSPTTHTHDARYYTQSQIDARLDAISTAYQVAQSDGFTGTVQEWLASLVGPQGVEGPYGGTAVTDPQVASYVTSATETRAALDARYLGNVSVTEYGATGDGTTDDTAAIQAAVSAATPFGAGVYIPGGRYRLDATIELSSNAALTLAPDAVIDVSSMTVAAPAFRALGTLGASKPLTADATRGADVLTVAATDGIAPGDWVKVSSQLPWGYTDQPAGEIQRVAEVTATTITVSEPLADSYTLPYSALVERVSMVEDVTIEGGHIVGDAAQPTELVTGVHFDMVHNATVSGVKMRWIHYVGVNIIDSVGVTVQDCSFDESLGSGLGYGIVAAWAAQDVSVVACHSTRVRHLVAFGGGTARGGIVRRVTVTGCTASDCFDAGLDSHPGAEDITFVGNVISGSHLDGIVVQGGRFVIANNIVTGSARHGIMVQNLTRRGLEGVVSGNVVSGSKGRGIMATINTTPEWRVWSGFAVTGNIVTDGESSGISVENPGTDFKVEGVTITGNTVRRHPIAHGIYLRGVQDATIGTNHISGVGGSTEGIYLASCADSTVVGNMIRGGARAIRIVGSPGITVSGNRGTGSALGLLSDTASAPVVAMGNSFAGCTTKMSLGGAGNVSSAADAGGAYNL